ncbi:hypothetical protein OSB04_000398 [Centaurea solstitialis]|uniref:Uncharacterized protein n=1 Tax=Centaurea solstitialis TaxID=347529 RepID=A0AA38U7B2_9ASTR|nr:hypothetical protein OSB04_000398 [Centaurea solstitialis]
MFYGEMSSETELRTGVSDGVSGLGSAVDEIGEVLYEILLGLLSVKKRVRIGEARKKGDSVPVDSGRDNERVGRSVRVRGEDVHKAVFYIRYVYCEFIVMSFGLTNAPTAFVDPVNQKCRPMLVRSVILCLDEMLIYWGSREMQVEYIRGVLETYARHVECGGKKTAAIEILRRKLCEALGLISPGEVEDMAA